MPNRAVQQQVENLMAASQASISSRASSGLSIVQDDQHLLVDQEVRASYRKKKRKGKKESKKHPPVALSATLKHISPIARVIDT